MSYHHCWCFVFHISRMQWVQSHSDEFQCPIVYGIEVTELELDVINLDEFKVIKGILYREFIHRTDVPPFDPSLMKISECILNFSE
jgi:hypothetical protein